EAFCFYVGLLPRPAPVKTCHKILLAQDRQSCHFLWCKYVPRQIHRREIRFNKLHINANLPTNRDGEQGEATGVTQVEADIPVARTIREARLSKSVIVKQYLSWIYLQGAGENKA